MGSREVPFKLDAICDICGCLGAFDFMGDYFCSPCTEEFENREEGDCISLDEFEAELETKQ